MPEESAVAVVTWVLRLLNTVRVAPGSGTGVVQSGSEQASTLPLTVKPGTVSVTVTV